MWLHSSFGRASHWYHKVTGLNQVEVMFPKIPLVARYSVLSKMGYGNFVAMVTQIPVKCTLFETNISFSVGMIMVVL